MSALRLLLDTAETVGAPREGARRFWTGREEVILRDAYPKGGVAGCLARLPGRSAKSIYARASMLGLRVPADAASLRRQTYATSDAIDDAIRKTYQGCPDKGAVKRLAQSIDRPRQWIYGRAVRLGIAVPRFKALPWTEAENDILAEHAHLDPAVLRAMLKKAGFQRSDVAIVVQRKRLGASTADPEHFTAGGLAELFGVDPGTIIRWIEKDWLRASRRGTARVEQQGGDQWWIHRSAVRGFVIANTAAVDFRKVDKTWLVDLLAGSVGWDSEAGNPEVLFLGPVTLDSQTRTARCGEQSVPFTPQEIAILQAIAARAGRFVTAADIIAEIRTKSRVNLVGVLVHRIRFKLAGIGAPAMLVGDRNGPGSRGYAIQLPAERGALLDGVEHPEVMA
ncbi:hypothetical protein [Rhodopila sp.]|uniref:hypothetical protein n=1 Tax=Rhodopila sp. TaxID=2480087 RepID=UPI003D0C2C64